jgi:hypothetical protein
MILLKKNCTLNRPEQHIDSLERCIMCWGEVGVLVNEAKNAGTYSVQWNASKFSSGIYFVQLQAGEYVQMRKMVLLK